MAKCALVRVQKERDGIHKQAGLRARAKEGSHPARSRKSGPWSCGRAALAKLWPSQRSAQEPQALLSHARPSADPTGSWMFREPAWCSLRSQPSKYRAQSNMEPG